MSTSKDRDTVTEDDLSGNATSFLFSREEVLRRKNSESGLILRREKGEPLSYEEMDENLQYLELLIRTQSIARLPVTTVQSSSPYQSGDLDFSILPVQGTHTVSAEGGTIGGGCMSSIVGSYGTISGGCQNYTCGNGATVGGGILNNACADNSGILGGQCNSIAAQYPDSMIVGNCITADRCNTTFVNNLSIMDIPTSSAGLPTGAVWNDGGTLKIV